RACVPDGPETHARSRRSPSRPRESWLRVVVAVVGGEPRVLRYVDLVVVADDPRPPVRQLLDQDEVQLDPDPLLDRGRLDLAPGGRLVIERDGLLVDVHD